MYLLLLAYKTSLQLMTMSYSVSNVYTIIQVRRTCTSCMCDVQVYRRDLILLCMATLYFSWVSWRTDWQCWLLYP